MTEARPMDELLEKMAPEGKLYMHPGAGACVPDCHEYDKGVVRAALAARSEPGAEGLRRAIRAALDELGVPGPGYPAPVANAVTILSAALAARSEPGAEGLRELRERGITTITLTLDEYERLAATPAADSLPDALRFHPVTGDGDFGQATMQERLDTLADYWRSEGMRLAATPAAEPPHVWFERGYRAATPAADSPDADHGWDAYKDAFPAGRNIRESSTPAADSRYRCVNCGRDENGCECEGGGSFVAATPAADSPAHYVDQAGNSWVRVEAATPAAEATAVDEIGVGSRVDVLIAETMMRTIEQNWRYTDGRTRSVRALTGLVYGLRSAATPAADSRALATDGLSQLISTILRKYGGTMKGRGDHDIFDALVRYRAALTDPDPAS